MSHGASLLGSFLLVAAAHGQGFGSELFEPPQAAGNFGFASLLATGDIDGDGLHDLIARDLFPAGPNVHVLLATGGGAFTEIAPALAVPPGMAGFTPRLADLDGDGAVDLVAFAAQPTPMKTCVALGQGDGSFLPPLVSPAPSTFESKLDVGDLDGDGMLDLAWAKGSVTVAAVGWQRGSGDGFFAASVELSGARHPGAPRVADLDDDGDADLAFLERQTLQPLSPTSLIVLELQAGGVAGTEVFACGTVPFDCAFALGDLDGDGDEDAVVADEAGLARRLLGAPGAGFREAVELAQLVAPLWGAEAPDLDRDGFADLLGYATDETLVALRCGPGGSAIGAPLQVGTVGTPTQQLVTGDFDGDGLIDAAVPDVQSIAVFVCGLGPFIDLGHALGGPQGTPALAIGGQPSAGGSVSITIDAPAGAAGLLFVGLETLNAPLGAGLLVPDPLLALPVVAGAQLSGHWPDVPAGAAVYLQAWFGSAAQGLMASNAVEIVAE